MKKLTEPEAWRVIAGDMFGRARDLPYATLRIDALENRRGITRATATRMRGRWQDAVRGGSDLWIPNHDLGAMKSLLCLWLALEAEEEAQ